MSSYASSSRQALYHCPCVSESPLPPSSPSSHYSFHSLDSLYFCEECDAVRCPDCIATEVGSYYCPNCLFDVPTANVRAEKNRCARNCFQCPICHHSLSVLASDNTVSNIPPIAPEASIGVPPYFLQCSSCKWTSSEIGMKFDKPTGLAHQLQKLEDQSPDLLEFDHLKTHFETYLAKTASITSPPPTTKPKARPSHHISTITAAASHALQRDVPGLAKARPRATVSASPARRMTVSDEMDDYKSLADWTSIALADGLTGSRGPGENDTLELMRSLQHGDRVASLENRLDQSWAHSPATAAQVPTRIPLVPKPTKRCPDCRHILIQPESKAASVRYKIKLVASNYLPLVEIGNRRLRGRGSGSKAEGLDDDLEPGRAYLFQLAFTNPLYDPITLRLAPARPSPGGPQIHLPTQTFQISALKDAWAYDGEEDNDHSLAAFEEDNQGTGGRSTGSRQSMGGRKAVVERRENSTKVGLEVLIPHDCAEGRLEFDMQVAYTYRADDPVADKDKTDAVDEFKTFSYWVRVSLGELYLQQGAAMTRDDA